MNNVQETIDTSKSQGPLNLSVDEAADAILARWQVDADGTSIEPSKDNETEATAADVADETDNRPQLQDTDDQTDEFDTDEDTDRSSEDDTNEEIEDHQDDDTDIDTEEDEGDAEADDAEAEIADDDLEVEIVVNGETRTVSVASLKRLYGQEASLTQKSQRVAEQRKVLDDAIGKNHLAFQKLLEKAQERWQPYSEVDMLVASKALETEDFAALRKEAEEAFNDLKFLNEEADAFYKNVQDHQKTQLAQAAKECVKVLQEDIPNWNNQLYQDIRTYAVSQGLDEAEVNNYVDPAVIKILNKARLYDAGKKVATVKKKAATTKKTLRNTKAPMDDRMRKSQRVAETKQKLRSSNDLDDIAEALLTRWQA